jgi:hypothetical protein
METIFIIFRVLEYLKGLMKLARKKKDIEVAHTQVVNIVDTLTIRRSASTKFSI